MSKSKINKYLEERIDEGTLVNTDQALVDDFKQELTEKQRVILASFKRCEAKKYNKELQKTFKAGLNNVIENNGISAKVSEHIVSGALAKMVDDPNMKDIEILMKITGETKEEKVFDVITFETIAKTVKKRL